MIAKCAKLPASPYVVTEELVEPGKPKRSHSVRLTKKTVLVHLQNAAVEADHGNGQDDGPATLIKQKIVMLPSIRRMLEWFHFLWSVQASPKGSKSVSRHLVVTAEVEAGHVNGQDNGPVPLIMRKKPNLPPTLNLFRWSYLLRCLQALISSVGPKVPSLLRSRGQPSSPANLEPLVRQPRLLQL